MMNCALDAVKHRIENMKAYQDVKEDADKVFDAAKHSCEVFKKLLNDREHLG